MGAGPVKQATKIEFTRRQVEWLEYMFPEMVGTPSTSDAELRFRSGQRSVIAVMRNHVANQQEN